MGVRHCLERPPLRAPRPGNSEQPDFVALYADSAWRRDSMSLLEFLRKTSGGSVLVALPTARLATRMAARLGDHESLVVDTFTAAFQLHKPEQEGLYAMCGYDLVVVDEFSQLSRADFERILRLWRAADCLPALVFLGDKYQLPGVDPQRAWESAAWSSGNCYFLELTQVFRCDDPAFLETLQLLRTAMPTKAQLNKICRGHKAWAGDKPDAEDLRRLLREHPEATLVAATKQGVAEINALALEALHPRAAPLATVAGAFEDNPENYVSGKLRDDRLPVPADVPIHRGARLYLTRNVRKADDYVNGMRCEVLSFDAAQQALGPNGHGEAPAHYSLARPRPLGPLLFPGPAGLLHYGAQGARRRVSIHYHLPRRPQHAGRRLYGHEPRQERALLSPWRRRSTLPP